MELSFVISALKRYWWIALACLVLGTAGGFALRSDEQPTYSSVALLLISPPSDTVAVAGNTSDRYVAGQLQVLASEASAATVAADVGDGATATAILAVTTVAQIPGTDMVSITVETEAPDRSQQIAQSYVDHYLSDLQSQLDATQGASLSGIEDRMNEILTRLDEIDVQIAAAMAPYLTQDTSADAAAFPPIPATEQVVPELVSEKQRLQAEYDDLNGKRNDLELGSKLRVTTQVAQSATLPSEAIVSGQRKIIAAGVLAGLFLGLVGAVVAGRLSPRVLDDEEAEEILGKPFAGAMPGDHALRGGLAPVAGALVAGGRPIGRSFTTFVDHLSVRVQAAQSSGEALLVVVAGVDPASGTTTIATALAGRLAREGSRVLLLDADHDRPVLTEVLAPAGVAHERGVAHPVPDADHLAVARAAAFAGADPLRRQDVPELVHRAMSGADVVVIDGGPVLSSASTLQLIAVADAVVLAVCVAHQRKDHLGEIGRELEGMRGSLLPVTVGRLPAGRQQHG